MFETDTPQGNAEYVPAPTQARLSPLDELGGKWLRYMVDHGAQPRTTETYADSLIKWAAYCDMCDIDPLKPTLEDMEAFMKRPRPRLKNKPGSAATQAIDAKALRGMFKWLSDRGYIQGNPALDLTPPKSKKRLHKPVEDEDWVKLWHYDLPPRIRCMLGLGYYAGLRLEEMYTLQAASLTETRVRNYIRKGGGEDSTPWLDMAQIVHDELPFLLPDLDILRSSIMHVRNNHDRLVPWTARNQLWKRMEFFCGQVGIRRYSPHQLRHSACTNLFRTSLATRPHLIMTLMNHSSLDTTMGYARSGHVELREFLNRRSNT